MEPNEKVQSPRYYLERFEAKTEIRGFVNFIWTKFDVQNYFKCGIKKVDEI